MSKKQAAKATVWTIEAKSKKGKAFTLPSYFVQWNGLPLSFTGYLSRMNIPTSGEASSKKRDDAKLEWIDLRNAYQTISSIAFAEVTGGNSSVQRLTVRPVTDRGTKQPTGEHAVNIGLLTKTVLTVTAQLEKARHESKLIRDGKAQLAKTAEVTDQPKVPAPRLPVMPRNTRS